MKFKKSNNKIYINYKLFSINILEIINKIIFLIILSNEKFLNKLNLDSEISMIINGTGIQSILYFDYNYVPDKILINGIYQNYTDKYVKDLSKEINNITMIWTYQLTTCNSMFYTLRNIISFDFSKFDTSKVSDMSWMFAYCSSLTSLDLSNFNTSKVNDMSWMFAYCSSLTSLDLCNFNTSKVNDMSRMFAYCSSLTSLDLSNFNTSLVKSFYFMFSSCTLLKTLDLNNFDTSLITSFFCMFYRCHSLISLNINNFNLKSAKEIDFMFEDCFSLISLDLYNFETSEEMSYADAFKNINNSIIIRFNETKVAKIIRFLERFNNTPSDICFTNPNHKLVEELRKCVNTCDEYKYEYKNICYNECPKGLYNLNDSKCIDYIPDGYYLNFTTINKCDIKCKTCSYESITNNLCISCNIDNNYYPKFNISSNDNNNYINCYQNLEEEGYYLNNNTYKSCYYTCKSCNKTGNEENNQCLTCKYNYTFYEFENKFNCYKICEHYYYFDQYNNFNCTLNNTCPQGFKLIKEKNKCIDNCTNDNTYKIEFNNSCYISLPNTDNIDKEFNLLNFFYNKTISNNNPELIDEKISNIKNQIMNGEINYIFEDVIIGQGNDLIKNDGNIIYQILLLIIKIIMNIIYPP